MYLIIGGGIWLSQSSKRIENLLRKFAGGGQALAETEGRPFDTLYCVLVRDKCYAGNWPITGWYCWPCTCLVTQIRQVFENWDGTQNNKPGDNPR